MSKPISLSIALILALILGSCKTQAPTVLVSLTYTLKPSPTITQIPSPRLQPPTVLPTYTLKPSPTTTLTPPPPLPTRQQPCKSISASFELDYSPDTGKMFSNRLVQFLNTGAFPTPVATMTDDAYASTIHVVSVIDREEDITNDSIPEIFLSAITFPEDETDVVGVWAHYLILSCSAGKYQILYNDVYQNLYQHLNIAIVSDSNGNSLPEVAMTYTYTHWETIIVNYVLEWDGERLQIIQETRATPTPLSAPNN